MADNDEEIAMPRDAKILKSLLKSMGVDNHESFVINYGIAMLLMC